MSPSSAEALLTETPKADLVALSAPLDAAATARALAIGSLLGALLAAANVYVGLKTGYIDGGSIAAALVGSALLGLFGRGAATPAAVNLVQTVASSAAVMSFAAGVCAPVPALGLLGRAPSGGAIFVWGLGLGGLGVALGCLLRGRLVVAEALPFPTGRATAEVIEALDREGRGRRLLALGAAAAGAGIVAALRDGPAPLLPAGWAPSLTFGGLSAAALTLSLAYSPLMAATGVLVGVRGALSMALGALVAWAAIAPGALRLGLASEATYAALVPVLLWPGLALVVGSALTTLVASWRTFGRALGDLRRLAGGRTPATVEAPLPPRALAALTLLALPLVVAVGAFAFGLGALPLSLLITGGLVLAAASARAAGETDQAPIGAVGALAQLGLGGHGAAASLAGGALVSGLATQTAQTLWAFKAGRRLGAPARPQALAQLLGVLVGAAVVVPVYTLVRAAHPLGSELMPAPGALSWRATAEAAQGAFPLSHPFLWQTTAAAAALGVALTRLERRFRWLPSPTAAGAAFVLPASAVLAMLAGSLLFALLGRRFPRFASRHGLALAAGCLTGEALVGVALAARAAL